jgi:RimJ/RimL family protein N-acetyltransferase
MTEAKIKCATDKDFEEFKTWAGKDSIYDLTCRPISPDNKRIAPSGKTFPLSFFIDEVEFPIGRFTYFDYNIRNQSAEFGYILKPEFRGKGYSKLMLKEAFNYIFTETDMNKLYCQTASFNTASVKLLKSLGMHLDGNLRQHHEKNGELFDDYIFSILRSEWQRD